MLAKTYTVAVNGLETTTITVEVDVNKGFLFHLTGLPDSAVKESYERIRSAAANVGFRLGSAEITVNLSPADIKKEGSGYDLPVAVGILAAFGNVSQQRLSQFALAGELSLDGRLQPIRGALPIAIRARAEKFKGLIVPVQNVREAAVVNNLEVYGMESLSDVVQFFNGSKSFQPTVFDTRKEFYANQFQFDLDFSDVRGQEPVKRALEVAAAGGHNVIKISLIIRQQQMLDKQFFMLYFIIQNPFLLQKQAA